jgi:Mg2+/Co2+ transporter CorB
MTSDEWAIVGIALALAVLAIGILGLRMRMAGGGVASGGFVAQAVPIVEPDAAAPTTGATGLLARSARTLSELHELEVSDVMVHRMNMRSINVDDPPDAILRTVIESPYTRMPLWRGSLDNIVGVLHSREVLRALGDVAFDFARFDPLKIASKPWFVPDTTRLDDQLNAFLRRKSHFAIVVDEYGDVRGLITLEDIIEEIVGEISDEYDVDVEGVRQEADGSVVVDGSVAIRDLNRALGWGLPDDEATTIAGLVIHETQSIPEEKQAFTFHGKRFVVMKRERNRITRLRIRPAVEG